MDAVMKTEQKEVQDWAVQNDNKPLWTRSPREVRPVFAPPAVLMPSVAHIWPEGCATAVACDPCSAGNLICQSLPRRTAAEH